MSRLSRKLLSLLMILLLIFAYCAIPSNAEIDIPFNIQAAPAITSITISWDEVAGAAAYDLEADGVIIENITETSYEDTGLIPETEHTYRVRAINGEAVGEWSEPVTVSTTADIGQ